MCFRLSRPGHTINRQHSAHPAPSVGPFSTCPIGITLGEFRSLSCPATRLEAQGFSISASLVSGRKPKKTDPLPLTLTPTSNLPDVLECGPGSKCPPCPQSWASQPCSECLSFIRRGLPPRLVSSPNARAAVNLHRAAHWGSSTRDFGYGSTTASSSPHSLLLTSSCVAPAPHAPHYARANYTADMMVPGLLMCARKIC